MNHNQRTRSKLSRNWKSNLLISSIFIFFFALPIFFSLTSDVSQHIQPDEQIGLMKEATDLLAIDVWIPLFIISCILLGLAFLLTRRIAIRDTGFEGLFGFITPFKHPFG